MNITAIFRQGVLENKRYVLDYTLDLATGEVITAFAVQSITTIQNQSDANSPTLVVDDVLIGPGGLQVIYFVNNGVINGTYFVSFLATTSTGQILNDVVQYNTTSFTT